MSEQAPKPIITEEQQAARLEAFPAVAAFAVDPANEFAAGPQVRKGTGLTQEKIWGMGYGSFDEVKQDALSWKAEQDAAAARDAYHQVGEEQAANWHQEMADYRAAKKAEADEAAAKRAIAQRDAEEASIKTTAAAHRKYGSELRDYRKNLQQHLYANTEVKAREYSAMVRGNGRMSVERFPEVADRIHDEAYESAKADGWAVEMPAAPDRQTIGKRPETPVIPAPLERKAVAVEIVRNTAAEERAAKIAQDLKAHDKAVAAGQLAAQEKREAQKEIDRDDGLMDQAVAMNTEFDEQQAADRKAKAETEALKATAARTEAAAQKAAEQKPRSHGSHRGRFGKAAGRLFTRKAAQDSGSTKTSFKEKVLAGLGSGADAAERLVKGPEARRSTLRTAGRLGIAAVLLVGTAGIYTAFKQSNELMRADQEPVAASKANPTAQPSATTAPRTAEATGAPIVVKEPVTDTSRADKHAASVLQTKHNESIYTTMKHNGYDHPIEAMNKAAKEQGIKLTWHQAKDGKGVYAQIGQVTDNDQILKLLQIQ